MKYSALNVIHAREALLALSTGERYDFDRVEQIKGRDLEFDLSIVEDLQEAANRVMATFPASLGRQDAGDFESALVEPLHRTLRIDPMQAADREFWIWLSVRHFFDLVQYRHGDGERLANEANFGLRGKWDGLLCRVWFRAEIAFDSNRDDPYELAKLGDQDFWRSHVLRVRFGACRSLVKALVEFQYPDGSAGKARLKTADKDTGIRMLAKLLRRTHATRALELYARADAHSLLAEISPDLH